MTSGQKVAFSLLISVLAFCAFAVVAFSGLFDLLEVNFYQPVVQEVKQKKIEEIAAAQNEYFQTLMKRFDAFSLSSDVKTYALSRPDDVAVRGRERLRSELVTSTAALSGIRIVDDNGRNIYFSTYSSDIISDKKGISYRNYNASDELNYDSVRSKNLFQASSEDRCRIIKDGQNKRIIFSLPFYNPENEYKGSILFYCNPLHFSQFLYNRNLIDVKGFAELVTAPMNSDKFVDGFGGFVFGLPNYGQESIKSEILEKWRAGDDTFWKLQPVENPDQAAAPDKSGFYDMDAFLGRVKSNSLCAFSYRHAREDFGFITLLYGENELKFPPYIRVLLLATAFVTLYLAIFLILSFKHDDVVIIRDKIRRYESEFFIGYKKNGENRDGAYLLEQKEILEKRILKSLGKRGEKHAAEFKAIFESSWQEFSAQFIGAPAVTANLGPAFNAAELKEIVRSSLEDILENGKIQINAATVISSSEQKEIQNPDSPVEAAPAKVSTEVAEAEDAEEIEKVAEAEDAEEIEEIPEAEDAEKIEEVAEAEDAEEIEEVAEAEDAEEIEEAAEAEDAEELEKVAEAEDAEEIEEIPEAEDAEEIEEVAEAEDAEEIEEIPEAEDAEEIEEVPEAEDAEEIEEVAEAEDAEEIEEITEAEDAEEIEEVPEAEDAEEIEEIPEAEDAEKIEEVAEAEDAEEIEEVAEAEDAEEIEEITEAEDAEEIEEIPEAEDAEEIEEIPEAEDAEEIEEVAEAEDAEELEEIEELSGANSEADVSEELEPITDMSEELRFGDGRMPSSDDGDTDFSAVGEEALKQKFEEELEMLPEVSEREERAIDIAKTLEALPEHAPHLDDDDDELDSAGLSRKPSFAERHDIAKLRDAVRSVEKMDTNLEELEPIDAALPEEEPEQSPSKPSNGSEQNTKILPELLDTDFYLPHLFDNNIYADDDVYKDEALLEKIEFGVPTAEIHDEVYDESVAENFVAFPLDYSSLDEDDADEKMYEEEPADDDRDSLLFFENPLVESNEKKQKETLENTEESAENQTTALEDELPALESVVEDDAEEVVTLDSPEENMPFMFTKFSLDADTQVVELSPVMSDAIVQDADGTFRVTEFTHPENVTLDADFKKLVDSILR
ncbi:MAG: hypothetical protein IJ207_07065 [Treponema sp.]|uniref:hypothetical protein n=1 Tax=Treponema sp. TaxID=166 RepID=UPI0025F25A9C|nr:hypothetical protein [Treponema sp.]MBQ9281945.1 hypothetical protein [Treponema sp.]